MPRRLITGFCLLCVGLLSGCANFDAFSGMFSGVQFAARPIVTLAARHQFTVGDSYLYKIGAATSEEKVTRVTGQNVWWKDNWGRQWMTDGGTLLPPKEFQTSPTTPKSQRVSLESTGPLYPLLIGKSVSFRYAKSGGGMPDSRHTQDCAIIDYGGVVTQAGPFNVFKLNCSYDGDAYTNYYAPSIGRVVLQTGSSLFASVERELIGFRRGGGAHGSLKNRGEMSNDGTHAKMAPHDGKSMKLKNGRKPAAGEMAMMGKSGQYGVQLAAYKAAAPARRAWAQIKKRGGDLLSGRTPSIERHTGRSGSVYRLIVGGFNSKAKAVAHCKALKRKRIDCWARPTASQPKPAHTTRKHSAATPEKAVQQAKLIKIADARQVRARNSTEVGETSPAQLHFAKP